MNLKTLLVFFLGSTLLWSFSLAQQKVARSEDGWHIVPRGRFHILVVYAEMNFDSSYAHLDPVKPEGLWKWKRGEFPAWADNVISREPSGDGWMTKYYRQASFGEFQVTGDYLDTLITLNISDVVNEKGKIVENEAFASNYYRKALLRKLNAIQNPRFRHGSKLEEFDRWTFTGSRRPEPNQQIDLVMVIWRNIHCHNLGNQSGFVSAASYGELWGWSTDMHSVFRSSNGMPATVMRHEFGHMVYGGNNFHTANGGVGQRTFMPTVGGWSNMSASDACSPVWNAWDRERCAWRHPDNQYVVSARCADTGEEIDGKLVYGEPLCGNGEVMLRDFVSQGDAICIRLPHIPGDIKQQYLWLENHQMKEGYVDHDKALTKGLYAYITAGKDVREGKMTFVGANNYFYPLPSFGQHDFYFGEENEKGAVLHADRDRANPLTGYHYLMRVPRDLNADGKLYVSTDVRRPKTEYQMAYELVVDGDTLPEDYFSYQKYPIFGTRDVGFSLSGSRKIGLSYNPAPTPLYTSTGPNGPLKDDNRRIYLNGISIEILEETSEGDLRLKIRWDDFDVVEDLRWCGDIWIKEKVNVNGAEILLDQGLSIQERQKMMELNGEAVFMHPTIMVVDSGATLTVNQGGVLRIARGSTLLVRKGGQVRVENRADIVVEPGAYIFMEDGSRVQRQGRRADVNLRAGAKVGLHPHWAEQWAGKLDAPLSFTFD